MPITDVDSIIAECQRPAGQFIHFPENGIPRGVRRGFKNHTHGNDDDDDLL